MTLDYFKYRSKIRPAQDFELDIMNEEKRAKERELDEIIYNMNNHIKSMNDNEGNIVCQIEFPHYLTIQDLVEVFSKQGYYLYGDKMAGAMIPNQCLYIGTKPTLNRHSLTEEQLVEIIEITQKTTDMQETDIDNRTMEYLHISTLMPMLKELNGIEVRNISNGLNIKFI